MFRSTANNLAPGSFNGVENLFLRNLQAGTNVALTTGGVTSAAMTPDGHFVAFVGAMGGGMTVWDSTLGRKAYSNTIFPLTNGAVSLDGSRVAYWVRSSSGLIATDLVAHAGWKINTNLPAGHPGLRFSADNRFLAYAAAVNGTNQVYLYDFVASTNILVSHAFAANVSGDGPSDSPDISSDDRFVAYRSAASNIVPDDTNGVADIFLFDRQAGATTLASASYFGNHAANNRSSSPVFSGDGMTLFFQSWASDLAGADFNQASDVVACNVYASGAIPIFSVTIFPGGAPGQGPWLAWQAVPGRSYRVQFKNTVDDSWQELNGNVTIVGNQGYCQDIAPSATQRYYRIVGQ